MFLFLLYPLGQAAATGLVLVSILRRDRRHLRKAATILFLLHTAIFVFAYVEVSLDPYFDDNGSREFIRLEDRWFWALLLAGLIELIAGPVLFLGYLFLKRDPETDPLPADLAPE